MPAPTHQGRSSPARVVVGGAAAGFTPDSTSTSCVAVQREPVAARPRRAATTALSAISRPPFASRPPAASRPARRPEYTNWSSASRNRAYSVGFPKSCGTPPRSLRRAISATLIGLPAAATCRIAARSSASDRRRDLRAVRQKERLDVEDVARRIGVGARGPGGRQGRRRQQDGGRDPDRHDASVERDNLPGCRTRRPARARCLRRHGRVLRIRRGRASWPASRWRTSSCGPRVVPFDRVGGPLRAPPAAAAGRPARVHARPRAPQRIDRASARSERTTSSRPVRSARSRSSSSRSTSHRPGSPTQESEPGRDPRAGALQPPAAHDGRGDALVGGRDRPGQSRCRCSSSTTGPSTPSTRRSLRLLDHLVAFGELPPLRAALLPPPLDRFETYSASARYAARSPRNGCRRCRPSSGRPVGLGASLGALALLHAHYAKRGCFGGLVLQSGSFFRRRFDSHESDAPRYARITRFVSRDRRRPGRRGADPGDRHVRHGRGEPGQQPLARRDAPGRGWPVELVEHPTRTTGSRGGTSLHPHLADLILPGAPVRREDRDGILAYGSYGRPLLVFPAQQGQRYEWEERGMIHEIAGADRGRPREGLLRRLVGLRDLARRRGCRSRSAPGGTAPTRTGCVGHVAPWIHADCGGAAPDRRHGRLDGRLPRRELDAPPRRPLPARALPVRDLRRRRESAGASAATPSTSTTRWTTSRNLHGDHLDWLRSRVPPGARRRPRRLGGLDRLARVDAAVRGAARREGDPARAGRVGRGLAARLARVAAPDRASSSAALPEHLIGLLLGTEDDWPRVFEALVERLPAGRAPGRDATRSSPSGSRTSRSTCARSPATTS